MRRSALLATLALVTGAACTSLSGLTSSGGDDAGGFDASRVEDGAGLVESGADVAPIPAPPPDGGLDDAPSPDAGPKTGFCAGQSGLVFCSDFDEGPIGADWTNLIVSVDGGVLAALEGGASSPPSSLFAGGIALGMTADTEHVHVDRTVGSAGHAVYAFDVRFDAFDTNDQGVEFASITFAGATGSSFQLIAKSSGWSVGEEQHFADGGSSFSASVAPGVLGPTWTRIELEISAAALAGPNRMVTLRRDGVQVVTRPIIGNFGVSPIHVYLGIVYMHGPSSGAGVHADNVTLRFPDGG